MLARVALTATVLCGTYLTGSALQAQERSVSFHFEEASVQVRILSGGVPGSAELVDGDPARISVTDRAGRARTSLRLDGAVLTVENRSGAPADYLIAVPPGADVTMAVDGWTGLSVAAAGGGRRLTWRWTGGEVRAQRPAPARPGRVRHRRLGFTVSAYTGALVADSVDVVYPERIRALKIVLGAEHFRVSGDRSVRFGYDEPIRWGVVAPGVDEAEVTVELPDDIELFKVRIGGAVIWELEQGRARAYCEPVAEIRRAGGRDIWVFTPEAGHLSCPGTREPPAASRLATRPAGHRWRGRICRTSSTAAPRPLQS
jgi:hypothetical protein